MYKTIIFLGSFISLAMLITACTSAGSTPAPTPAQVTISPTSTEPAETAASPTEAASGASPTQVEDPPFGAMSEFNTDFSRHSVPYREILSGGPRKDGIPAIDQPQYVSVVEASQWIDDVEPVVFVQVGQEARAYPIQILMWHEIANDTLGGLPLVVSFCPLCNTAIVYERSLEGRMMDFGTTGRLRYSNLIMYDRQTESWWQQATGEAIVGEQTGAQLAQYPAAMIAWADFKSAHPQGSVLSRQTGYSRAYGSNPYAGYDDVNNPPFLYQGPETPGQLAPVARVLTIDISGDAVAFPYDALQQALVANELVGGQAVAVWWAKGAASALDSASIAAGKQVGSAVAYLSQLGERKLTFRSEAGRIYDQETGSEWDVLGRAVSGPLAGQELQPAPAINHFWFSWAAFKPDTRIWSP
jgi:hypothetical protein